MFHAFAATGPGSRGFIVLRLVYKKILIEKSDLLLYILKQTSSGSGPWQDSLSGRMGKMKTDLDLINKRNKVSTKSNIF
jgi:hypothetical protein